jgi:hypothetical protein
MDMALKLMKVLRVFSPSHTTYISSITPPKFENTSSKLFLDYRFQIIMMRN